MNPGDPLANLQPLREPAAISWWPPAPGWWALAALSLVLLCLALWAARRRHRRNAYRREALSRLDACYTRYRLGGDPRRFISQGNALLKRVALLAYPREEVAARHGEQWHRFLARSAPPGPAFDTAFASDIYRPGEPQADPDQFYRAARHWIRRHGRPR